VRYRVYDIFIVSASVTWIGVHYRRGREREREREEREREIERQREREIPAENHISGHLFLANVQLRQSIMYNCTR